ncbi:hypothetical protein SAMN06265222_101929 [Neorhodopirellula lusitana]|uniref:Uncharacterized protein n=1 Tax=Neorhodopirellula lusitana TaxID=445327 RepID=A0ABY1PUJ6_9BACT|nr:hypothetical protein SAMN06265222_101929 [Neorhodopirellula lusitana]
MIEQSSEGGFRLSRADSGFLTEVEGWQKLGMPLFHQTPSPFVLVRQPDDHWQDGWQAFNWNQFGVYRHHFFKRV